MNPPGRLMEGRKWQDGLHQAMEAKELVPITAATGQAARVTVQDYFRQLHASGRDDGHRGLGPAGTQEDLRPQSHADAHATRPASARACRIACSPREAKREAIVEEIAKLNRRAGDVDRHAFGGSLGTLGAAFGRAGDSAQVLNARYHERSRRSSPRPAARQSHDRHQHGGPGTDILLEPEVRENGGLHVIATEMHTSARIDRQLIGRAARQGDPGSFQFFLSLDDELLRCLTPEARQKLKRPGQSQQEGRTGLDLAGPLPADPAVPRTHAHQAAKDDAPPGKAER
jgi:preprotein translocase subunit SecA